MTLTWLFTANLTTWVTTELWISRTCLFLSFAIMAPTVILIILDAILWVFRASEQRGRHVVNISRTGLAKAVEHTRRLSEGAFSPAGAGSSSSAVKSSSGGGSSATSVHLTSGRDRGKDAARVALSSLDDVSNISESALSTGQNTPTDVRQRSAGLSPVGRATLPKEVSQDGGTNDPAGPRPLGEVIN